MQQGRAQTRRVARDKADQADGGTVDQGGNSKTEEAWPKNTVFFLIIIESSDVIIIIEAYVVW